MPNPSPWKQMRSGQGDIVTSNLFHTNVHSGLPPSLMFAAAGKEAWPSFSLIRWRATASSSSLAASRDILPGRSTRSHSPGISVVLCAAKPRFLLPSLKRWSNFIRHMTNALMSSVEKEASGGVAGLRIGSEV